MLLPGFIISVVGDWRMQQLTTCTLTGGVGRSKQARFDLIKRVSADSDRHLILVTATPHSGNEDAFRSLLSLLDEKFADLPYDMESDSRSAIRAELARHLVQRLRGNVIDQDKELNITTTSSSSPPMGRTIRTSSSDSGNTIH
ncbi:MAG: hypothetical protein O3A00_06610 [Planctomycetota bacterium]|nr:hypothetical protein [Planctomycetota bacterium]